MVLQRGLNGSSAYVDPVQRTGRGACWLVYVQHAGPPAHAGLWPRQKSSILGRATCNSQEASSYQRHNSRCDRPSTASSVVPTHRAHSPSSVQIQRRQPPEFFAHPSASLVFSASKFASALSTRHKRINKCCFGGPVLHSIRVLHRLDAVRLPRQPLQLSN